MAGNSNNPKIVAHIIAENIRHRKRVVLGEAIKQAGYSLSVQKHPDRVLDTKTFKEAFALESKQIVKDIDRDIVRIQSAFAKKNLTKEKAKTLTDMLDTLIKNKQLLSGGSTANVGIAVSISEHIANKYRNTNEEVSNKSSDDTS